MKERMEGETAANRESVPFLACITVFLDTTRNNPKQTTKKVESCPHHESE